MLMTKGIRSDIEESFARDKKSISMSLSIGRNVEVRKFTLESLIGWYFRGLFVQLGSFGPFVRTKVSIFRDSHVRITKEVEE